MTEIDHVVVVKLGGSLLTDKRGEEAARPETIARLAAELAAARPAMAARGEALLLGHGSGSFGHVAAARAGLGKGPIDTTTDAGIVATQAAAARLHRLVSGALVAAGERPFSIAPSAGWTARRGRLVAGSVEPVVLALRRGLLPVVYGDVVLDREWGAAIASTEEVVRFLVPRLARRGLPVRRVVWAGETPGVLDEAGRTVPELDAARLPGLLAAVGGAAGTDVTGGMLLRLRTARALARSGIESWIVDGSRPGVLREALGGAAFERTSTAPLHGTRFLADRSAPDAR